MPLSKSRVALLLIDWINDLEFDKGEKLFPQALAAAKATVALRRRAARAGLLAHLGASTLILTGIAGNFCVLFTAQDAYMRDFRLFVPRDCLASEDEADNRHALGHMAKVCKADTGASAGIDFARLQKAA